MDCREIVFGSDTAERKKWFTGTSFAHPAKMLISLQLYLIEHYTKAKGDYEFTQEMLDEADKTIKWCKCK